MKIRLGSHPSNLSLFILRHRGVIESAARDRGWQLEWFDYTQGARSGEWLADEQVDVVGTGSTPPISAQATGLDVAYLASSPPRNNNCALLTLQSNAISSLRGKQLTGMPGSFTDHFLARLLQKQNLRRTDVTLLDLQGQDAMTALLNGDIDGWLAIDPWLTRALQIKDVVARSTVGDEIINRSLFWTRAAWQQRYPEVAAWVVKQLRVNDAWIEQHPVAAAQILADKLNPAILPDEWLKTIRGRPSVSRTAAAG